MIAFVKGSLLEITEDSIILENHGIGYQIQVPLSFLSSLTVGEELQVFTYLYVREDALNLYGFQNREDLAVFRLLIGISGIGPKAALGILSVIPPDELRFAILAEDAKKISAAPGIGIKTARKLILELKDKFSLQDAYEIKNAHSGQGNAQEEVSADDPRSEVILSLEALGYSSSDAMRAVSRVKDYEKMNVEQLLKEALRQMLIK